MSLPRDKAEEILELCLSNESTQMKTKVYEILSCSGIQANDPMFLVLALTGQMRVLLETAPLELGALLKAWKSQNSESMRQLSEAIALVKEEQGQQVEKIKQSIEVVNSKSVDDLRALYKTFISEILLANTKVENSIQESVDEIRELKNQLVELNQEIKADRISNIKVMKALIEGIGRTNNDLDLANSQIQDSISILQKLQLPKLLNKWVILGMFISTLIVASLFVLNLAKHTNSDSSSNLYLIGVLANAQYNLGKWHNARRNDRPSIEEAIIW